MSAYRTKTNPFPGTSYREVKKFAIHFYRDLTRKSKRRPYVRSAYFKKQKIFLELFWAHLFHRNYWDQTRRMKLFACGIELIQKTKFEPTSKENPNKRREILHRFSGITPNDEVFFVQIKEDKSTGKKFLISIFPLE